MSMGAKRILYIQYTDPAGYPPLEHSSRMMAEAGWEILFLGIEQNHNLRFPPHPRIQVKLLPMVPPGWKQKLHYFYYWVWVVLQLMHWRPGWIYASDVFSTPIAWMLSYFPRLKVLYHEHDSPADSGQNSAFMRGVLGARQRLARRATANILPNEERGKALQQISNTTRPIVIVWNCPSKTEVPERSSNDDGCIRLLYQGSIVPERLPSTIIEALAQLPPGVKLHIVGYETQGAAGYSQHLRTLADELGVGHRLVLHGTIPHRADMLAHAASCHIGLAFMPLESHDFNMLTMAGASNKPFDYMACGMVLLITPLPEWEQLYTGYALACNPADSAALADAIRWYVEHPTERQQMGKAGRVRILKEWHYERQFEPVMHLIAAVY